MISRKLNLHLPDNEIYFNLHHKFGYPVCYITTKGSAVEWLIKYYEKIDNIPIVVLCWLLQPA